MKKILFISFLCVLTAFLHSNTVPISKILDNSKSFITEKLSSKTFSSEREFEKFYSENISNLVKEIKIKGIVTDEKSRPIHDAYIYITQIMDLDGSPLSDNSKPINLMLKTDKHGAFFCTLPSINVYRMGLYLANNTFPQNNFKIKVGKDGYKIKECTFLSMNADNITIATEIYDIMYKIYKVKGKSIPNIPRNLQIPLVNSTPVLNFKFELSNE